MCLNCGLLTSNLKFCSRSCAAMVNNRLRQKRLWICGRCGLRKDRPSTYGKICSDCKVAKSLETVARNRKYHKRYWQNWKMKRVYHDNMARINSIKESTPCTDCGVVLPAVCMDFDHLSDKYKDVSRLTSRQWSVIETEISKCEIVCANCHRLRTESRRLAREVSS